VSVCIHAGNKQKILIIDFSSKQNKQQQHKWAFKLAMHVKYRDLIKTKPQNCSRLCVVDFHFLSRAIAALL
jgi:hypothetical protein